MLGKVTRVNHNRPNCLLNRTDNWLYLYRKVITPKLFRQGDGGAGRLVQLSYVKPMPFFDIG